MNPVSYLAALFKVKRPKKPNALVLKLTRETVVFFSLACAEPPMNMSCSCLFAIKHAVESSRAEIEADEFFPLRK